MVKVCIGILNLSLMILMVYSMHRYHHRHRMPTHPIHFQMQKRYKSKILQSIDRRYLKYLGLQKWLTMNDFCIAYGFWIILNTAVCILAMESILMKSVSLAIMTVIPLGIMEYRIKKIDLSIDQGIFDFLTQLNAKLLKSEDVLMALDEVGHKLMNKHIAKVVRAFNQTLYMGGSPHLAFTMIKAAIDNEYLKYIFINIEIVYTRRGNVLELMRSLENEYTSIQVEINRRKVSLEHEKNMTLFSIVMVGWMVSKVIRDNNYVLEFYRTHLLLGGILVFFVIIGVMLLIKANYQKY